MSALPVVQPPPADSRQVVYAHTIAQWMALPEHERVLILQNLKLKDRLYRFLDRKGNIKRSSTSAPEEVPCYKCEGKGSFTKEPRHPGIHPSQISHPCLLRIWKEMNGEESMEMVEPRLQLIFDLGHAVHGMLQTYGLQGAWGPHYKPEISVNPLAQPLANELYIEGHADADNILRIDDIPGNPYVYEVGVVHEYKTISTKQFESLTKPKPEHKEQATIYSAVLDRPIVAFLYFSKNDSNLADFPIPFDPATWDRVKTKCQTLLDYYDRQVPAPSSPGYHCKDCGYLFGCPDGEAHIRRR